MDITLQGEMDGIETARILGARFNLSVIYLTSHSDKAVFEKAKNTNPYGDLTKPSKTDEWQKGKEHVSALQYQIFKQRIQFENKLFNRFTTQPNQLKSLLCICHKFIIKRYEGFFSSCL